MRNTIPLTFICIIFMLLSIYSVFLYSPVEQNQGIVQKIFYFHVSSAWVGFLAFFIVFLSSILFLWKKERKWDILAHSSAEIGVIFTTLVLMTGPLWAKPIWGVWWSWDPRLTTTLILWLIYVSYLMLRSQTIGEYQKAKFAAVLGIVGFLDVPLIHISVLWWRTLHPKPIVLKTGTPALPMSMFYTLIICLISFTLLYLIMISQRINIEKMKDEIRSIKSSLSE